MVAILDDVAEGEGDATQQATAYLLKQIEAGAARAEAITATVTYCIAQGWLRDIAYTITARGFDALAVERKHHIMRTYIRRMTMRDDERDTPVDYTGPALAVAPLSAAEKAVSVNHRVDYMSMPYRVNGQDMRLGDMTRAHIGVSLADYF